MAHFEAKYEIVENLPDVAETEDRIFIQVQWTGFLDKRDWTRNMLNELFEDIPKQVEEFLGHKKGKIAKAITAFGLK